jgi:hypothetical protein
MDTQAIRAQMPTLVSGHVPSNVRSFKFNIFDGQPKVSTLGFHIDPKPFEGKVIATTDEAIVVKTGRAEFAVLDRALVTEVPDEGAKVQVEPYARRRFDGLRADTPEEETAFTADGKPYTVKRFVLGSAPAKLPIPEPRCPELQELIQQMEQLPAPDGFRRITHLLVDAGARDFTWVDPLPKDIIATPPAIGFTVATAKFQGASPCCTSAASTSTRWSCTATASWSNGSMRCSSTPRRDAGTADRRRELAAHPRAMPVRSQAVRH